MPQATTKAESPPIKRDRRSALVAAALACLALPTIVVLAYDVPGDAAARRSPLVGLVVGALAGTVIPFLYWAPYRALGLVPFGSVGWLAATIYSVITGHWPGWAYGFVLGLLVAALTRGRRGPEPPGENYWLAAAVLAGAGVAWGVVVNERPFDLGGYFVMGVATGLTLWAWARLFRPAFEISCEPLLWLLYKVQGRGPGLADFPLTGPCIVIANHACWLDPLFLAKVLPRPVTPMMTSRFYNLPILRRLMVKFGVISVAEKAIKKDTPEIREAIAALDRGECVVIFPEGYLRRTEELPLRRFGQGIWQILQARPNVPLFACWIEGGWGSYTSYFGGSPTKNKKLDFRRPLGVGVSTGITVSPETLEDHLRTRFHLMNLVVAAREHLGLPALSPYEIPQKEEEKVDETPDEAA